MGAAGRTGTEATKPDNADTRTALTVVTAALTVAATALAAAAGETTVATAIGDAQLAECSLGGIEAADVVTPGASHVQAAAPAATVVIFREAAPAGCPVEMLSASAKDAIAEAAETKAAGAPQIAALGNTAAMAVFGTSAVTPDRIAPGDTNETRSAPCAGVLLLGVNGLLATTITATGLAPQANDADAVTLRTARLESAGTKATVTALTGTDGGRRAALSEMTVAEGALVTAGATTVKENAARLWAGWAPGTRATTSLMVMVGYHPTTLEHSLEVAKGAASAFLAKATTAMSLISTRGTESTIPGVTMACRSGTMMTCGARSLGSRRALLRMATLSSWSRDWRRSRPLLLQSNLAVESRKLQLNLWSR